MQPHLLAALGGVADPYPLVARVEPLHRSAVGPVDQALALEARLVRVEAEIQDRLHDPAAPLRGDGAGDGEPARPPRRTPRLAHRDRLALGRQALRHRDGLAGRVPDGHLQGDGLGIDRRADPLVQHALQPGFDQIAVVMHQAGLLRSVSQAVVRQWSGSGQAWPTAR
ncbi:hypothetical protein GCM10020220_044890 [Nonomuraea rubra]